MADLREYPTHLGLNVVFFASDLLAYGGISNSEVVITVDFESTIWSSNLRWRNMN